MDVLRPVEVSGKRAESQRYAGIGALELARVLAELRRSKRSWGVSDLASKADILLTAWGPIVWPGGGKLRFREISNNPICHGRAKQKGPLSDPVTA